MNGYRGLPEAIWLFAPPAVPSNDGSSILPLNWLLLLLESSSPSLCRVPWPVLLTARPCSRVYGRVLSNTKLHHPIKVAMAKALFVRSQFS